MSQPSDDRSGERSDARREDRSRGSEDVGPGRGRSTFLEVEEFLRRTRHYAERAQDMLIRRMREHARDDERILLFLDTIERQRAELEAALDRSASCASAHVLATVVQYTVDLWEHEPTVRDCHSIEEATRWMIELDDRLVAAYRELVESCDNAEVSEFFDRLITLVRGHDRTLSRQSQSLESL